MIDADERALMEQTARAAIADALAAESRADVDAVLAKLGWREMLRDEPDAAIGVVFGALGATNANATALDDVLAAALGAEPRAGLAVLLPRFGTWDPPGAAGLATARAASADAWLVASERGLGTVPRAAAEIRAVRAVDPELRLHEVRVAARSAEAAPLDPAAWRSAVALGRRAVAHQLLGASRAMLDLARSHALERTQFGRPIARFQAVRHRLADAFVAAEALEAALGAAQDEPGPETAALAKAIAGRTAHTVARHCQQVLGGIGFTTEHAFHRFAKRALALEGLFGSADAIARDAGRRLLDERRVPTLIEL